MNYYQQYIFDLVRYVLKKEMIASIEIRVISLMDFQFSIFEMSLTFFIPTDKTKNVLFFHSQNALRTIIQSFYKGLSCSVYDRLLS